MRRKEYKRVRIQNEKVITNWTLDDEEGFLDFEFVIEANAFSDFDVWRNLFL